MAFFDIFAWIVLMIIAATGVGIIILMGMWPGKVAHERKHPQAEAIAVGGWLTLFLGFVFWPLMVVWAYTKSPDNTTDDAQESAS
jgi:hypothetical protein